MKHRLKGKKLNRDSHARKALFRSLIQSLIIHEEIKTTQTKAKVLKRLVAKIITKAKTGSLSARRQILAFLPNKKVVNKLMDELIPRFGSRTSGFTRLQRLYRRQGDNSLLVKLELVDKKPVVKEKNKKEPKEKSKK